MSLLKNLVPAFGRASAAVSDNDRAVEYSVRPFYHVNETDDAYTATVQLPGVAKDGLEITAEDGAVTVVGRRAWKRPEGWTSLYRESADVAYRLVLQHDEAVDAEKVQAELRDGVLRLTLPKSEAIKPRKIAVN